MWKHVWILYSNMDSVIAVYRSKKRAISSTHRMMDKYGGKVSDVRDVGKYTTEIDMEDGSGNKGTFILLKTEIQ